MIDTAVTLFVPGPDHLWEHGETFARRRNVCNRVSGGFHWGFDESFW